MPYVRVVTPAYARPRSPQPHFTFVTARSSTFARRTPPHSQARIPLHSLARRGPRLLQGTGPGPLHLRPILLPHRQPKPIHNHRTPKLRLLAPPDRALTPFRPLSRWACYHCLPDLSFRAALATSDHYNRPSWGHESVDARPRPSCAAALAEWSWISRRARRRALMAPPS